MERGLNKQYHTLCARQDFNEFVYTCICVYDGHNLAWGIQPNDITT